MVQAWWAAGLALPAILAKSTLGNRGRSKAKEEDTIETRLATLPANYVRGMPAINQVLDEVSC